MNALFFKSGGTYFKKNLAGVYSKPVKQLNMTTQLPVFKRKLYLKIEKSQLRGIGRFFCWRPGVDSHPTPKLDSVLAPSSDKMGGLASERASGVKPWAKLCVSGKQPEDQRQRRQRSQLGGGFIFHGDFIFSHVTHYTAQESDCVTTEMINALQLQRSCKPIT